MDRLLNYHVQGYRPASEQLGLLSMALPSPYGDVAGLLGDAAGYAADPSSLTPARGLLSLAALAPGIPRGLKPEIVGRAADFKYGEAADDFLYHVTTPDAAQKIVSEGFKPGAGKSLWGGGYAGHSQGKAFLTERDGVGYWRDRIEEGLEQQMDDVPDLVVVRVPRSKVPKLQEDSAGRLTGGDYWFRP